MMAMMMMMIVLLVLGTEEIGPGGPSPTGPLPPYLPLGTVVRRGQKRLRDKCNSTTTKRSSLRRPRLTLVHPCPTLIARI